jgi:phosphate-selective porin
MRFTTTLCLVFASIFISNTLFAQKDTTKTTSIGVTTANVTAPKKNWYDNFSIRGYMQVRYNRLGETNPELKCEQCDRSWGKDGGFFLRRIRIIFSGNISDRVYMYIQPDFASSVSTTSLHFAQIRDAYFDVALDKKKEFRIRFGQSKIPFGFENMQSSQNRLPLDRNDALNSPLSNERDLGVMFYWAPEAKRKLLAHVQNGKLKGSGDYGILGLGLFNGQTANRPEANQQPHIVGRFTWPHEFKNKQIVEASVQAMTGRVAVTKGTKSKVAIDSRTNLAFTDFLDQRVAGSFVLYPQPFGIQAEYNVGTGPEYDSKDNTIKEQKLKGGYAQMSYRLDFGNQILFPFVRYQYYDGGKKHETDARSYTVKEFEIGAEWQPLPNFELVAMFTNSDRRFEDSDKPLNQQKGRLIRLQAQLNF